MSVFVLQTGFCCIALISSPRHEFFPLICHFFFGKIHCTNEQMKENQISIFSGKMLFFQKLFKIRCNQNPVSHQILFRLICQGLEIFTVKNDALWDKSIFRMACTASKIMCLVFGVTVWGNPQIVRLQKRFAVEFSPVVRKRSF